MWEKIGIIAAFAINIVTIIGYIYGLYTYNKVDFYSIYGSYVIIEVSFNLYALTHAIYGREVVMNNKHFERIKQAISIAGFNTAIYQLNLSYLEVVKFSFLDKNYHMLQHIILSGAALYMWSLGLGIIIALGMLLKIFIR